MKYTIIIDKQPSTNPSEGKKEYVIDIEELRTFRGVSDTLKVTPDMAYVIRRLTLSEYGVLSILDEPKQENIKDLNITLFEGDNYIYILNQQGNVISASYTIKNEFTDIYPTKAEMNSAIKQSAQSIELNVNQTLTGYATKTEMNSAIELNSNTIMLEVNKKVNDEDLTGANIILRINNDESESIISADKISLVGKEIDLTSDNITISSTNLSISKNGETIFKGIDNTSTSLTVQDTNNANWGSKIYPQAISVVGKSGYSQILAMGGCRLFLIPNSGTCSIRATAYEDDSTNITVQGSSSQTYITPTGITTPTLTQTSKSSEKKNFEKLNNALGLINKIDIYKYNLKTEKDTDKKHIGFVIGKGYRYRKEVTNKDNTGAEIYSFASLGIQGIKELDERLRKVEKILEVS